jgi:hypothetical protein
MVHRTRLPCDRLHGQVGRGPRGHTWPRVVHQKAAAGASLCCHQMIPEWRRTFPERRRMFPEWRQMFPEWRRMFPQWRQMFPQWRRMFPQWRQMFPQWRRMFPQWHRMFPQWRRMFPERRRMFTQMWEVDNGLCVEQNTKTILQKHFNANSQLTGTYPLPHHKLDRWMWGLRPFNAPPL